MKNLVIVESPAKAKTIEKYLGDGFVVKSSMGHIRDLVDGNHAIDIEKNFEPTYEISEGKQQLVKELSELSRKAETVWLATDDDREGESISWHLKEALHIPDNKVKRIVFREITKTAILKAVDNPMPSKPAGYWTESSAMKSHRFYGEKLKADFLQDAFSRLQFELWWSAKRKLKNSIQKPDSKPMVILKLPGTRPLLENSTVISSSNRK